MRQASSIFYYRFWRWLLALTAGVCLHIASANATDYTWTNEAADASGYWTNTFNWFPNLFGPGPIAGDNAFLTDPTLGSYTNILNAGLASYLSALTISNATGEAWLIITNNAAGTYSGTAAGGCSSCGTCGRASVEHSGLGPAHPHHPLPLAAAGYFCGSGSTTPYQNICQVRK